MEKSNITLQTGSKEAAMRRKGIISLVVAVAVLVNSINRFCRTLEWLARERRLGHGVAV